MERTGVLIDRDELARQSHQLGQRIQQLEARAYELAGQPFNMNSPKQLQEILFGRLGIDSKGPEKPRPGRFRSTKTPWKNSPPTTRCPSCCWNIAAWPS